MKSIIRWLQGLIQPAHANPPPQSPVADRVQSPPARTSPIHQPPTKEPVRVRGRLWKNTEEDQWALASQPETPHVFRVEDLIAGLGRANRVEVRRASAERLGRRGARACPAIAALILSTVDMDSSVRQAAFTALDEIDPAWTQNPETQKAIPALLDSLKSWSVETSKAAYKTLGLIGPPAVSALNDALLNGADTVDKVYVVRLLSQLGRDACDAIPGLCQALKSQFVQTRMAAAQAISGLGPCAEAAIPALIVNLTDAFAEARQVMAACLCSIGPAAEPAIPALVPLLADRNPEVRDAAASALTCMGEKAVPALIAVVEARDLQRIKAWVESTGRLFHSHQAVSPVLIAANLDKVLDNLSWAAYDILEEQASLQAAQESALRMLGEVGPVTLAVLPTIAGALKDPSPRLRLAAIRALARIGAPATPYLMPLLMATIDADPLIREAATKAQADITASVTDQQTPSTTT